MKAAPDTVLSTTHEDYLKNIWHICSSTKSLAGVNELASRMNLSPSTVSEAVKKLSAQNLVEHSRYSGIRLTAAGRAIALKMVRRHRLLETYLFTALGYSWEEVHAEAESLEHAVSDRFIAGIDALLNHPTHDPHGDPIPDADGEIKMEESVPLSQAPAETALSVARVSDRESDVLAYLRELRILPGTELRITAKSEVLGLITCFLPESPAPAQKIQITLPIAEAVWVRAERNADRK